LSRLAPDDMDWRAAFVTTLAADWVSPWTKTHHLAGSSVSKVTPGLDERNRLFSFVSPSPEALALDLASKAAADAAACRERINVTLTRAGAVDFTVADETLPALYDYFESCFVVVAFSFEALEAFANQEIAFAKPASGLEVVRRGQRVLVEADQLERSLNLDEKLNLLLPQLLGIPSPKGKKPWPGFRAIQTERDALLHLKAGDTYPRGEAKQSIFHRLWVDGVASHPGSALAMIEWFYQDREKPRWLTMARSHTVERAPR
jgi:hypothetical protein